MKNPIYIDSSSPRRVLRGGSWLYDDWDTCVFRRDRSYASYRHYLQGFRVFRSKGKL